MTSFHMHESSRFESETQAGTRGIDQQGSHPLVLTPTAKPIANLTKAERYTVLETEPNMEIHTTQGRRTRSRFWNAVLLPAADGVFFFDLDWTEGSFKRIQTIICPATSEGLNGMPAYECLIVAMLFVAPPAHDAQPRPAPLAIDAIGVGRDSKHGFTTEVLMRTVDGKWRACRKGVRIADVAERETVFDLTKSTALAEYLNHEPKPPKPCVPEQVATVVPG